MPYQYKKASFVNGLQWAIGLEIFLLSGDPWRLFFTTDHPNGAPFTRYPDLLHLLMDYDFRMACLAELDPEIMELTLLKDLKQEFSLYDIAIMTRAAPAKLLGLNDRGHLQPGALADIAVYREQDDKAAMFRKAQWVFKNGQLIIENGEFVKRQFGQTMTVKPHFDRQIETTVKNYFDRFYSMNLSNYGVQQDLLFDQPERFSAIRL